MARGREHRTGAAILAVALALPAAALAQAPSGSVSGVVVDAASSAPIADAVVTARGPALIGEQSAVTDATGAFEITQLPAGSYSLSIDREGYQPFTHAALAVKSGKLRVRVAIVQIPPPPPVPTAAADGALEFDETMTAPVMVSGPAPEYTTRAIERGIEGTMQVRCVVTSDGKVKACKVMKGLPFMNAAVVDALERRTYKPALAKGKPVDVYYTFSIRLTLPAR